MSKKNKQDKDAVPVAETIEDVFSAKVDHLTEVYAAETRAQLAKESQILAPAPVIDRDGWGRPIITDPATGKRTGYTRTTTHIDCLEDKTTLEKWKLRTALEGVVVNEDRLVDGALADGIVGDLITSSARDLIHNRDVALKKIAKADRKGKLEVGEKATLEAAALSTFRSGMDALADTALDLGGANAKSQKGTDLHTLTEEWDRCPKSNSGWEFDFTIWLAAKAELNQELTPADEADLRAYAEKMDELGIKHFAIEKFVVDDVKHVAGTADRLSFYKPAGAARTTRVVLDVKTGAVAYLAPKVGLQLLQYAQSQGYDPANPTEREDLKLSKKLGLVVHLPAGEARCTVYEVDLELAAVGLKLAGEVRDWRKAGKRMLDLKAGR
jgi:hypothetical protein